ncbi:AbrB/MazE/SpoVT family DNA-binding domain-containing protein [Agaribacter marinus]|uniref:AbrB/MazE/SpoVT family DNA-binding domain-containing protein n=1 Tax=Virgibacillus salarius TaxID=447199 RepID=A0A941I9D1_9BACI|nr:AbrB/MazE/SpoVT family DNA-binding domain-containing protein [Virgibacillus salarius]MBR7796639.1 AbrB/MazE/SpoVT family DNA-binding domain-containing protein [Virgibacillus salarius]NAZ09348.1 AbrB/MazE/SpoVT family DNA-binding domain-containing protein [Agaribacter marinus]
MKSTRVLRKVDNWGKIVVPSVFRDELNIKAKDLLEIFVDGDKIIFRKFVSSNVCMITGKVSENNIILANGKIILNQEILKDLIQEIEEEI